MQVIILLIVVFLVGCSTIQSYENLVQPVGQPLSTHIGGQVFKIKRTSDLPNAFGKADVWGGKVDGGFTEVRYQGLSDGKAVFLIVEIETQSNETSMSRYGGSYSTLNAQSYGGTTYGSVTTFNAQKGSTNILPPNSTQFLIDLANRSEFEVVGVIVKVLEAGETAIKYELINKL